MTTGTRSRYMRLRCTGNPLYCPSQQHVLGIESRNRYGDVVHTQHVWTSEPACFVRQSWNTSPHHLSATRLALSIKKSNNQNKKRALTRFFILVPRRGVFHLTGAVQVSYFFA